MTECLRVKKYTEVEINKNDIEKQDQNSVNAYEAASSEQKKLGWAEKHPLKDQGPHL